MNKLLRSLQIGSAVAMVDQLISRRDCQHKKKRNRNI